MLNETQKRKHEDVKELASQRLALKTKSKQERKAEISKRRDIFTRSWLARKENNDAYCGFREAGAGETPQALLHDMSAVWCEEPLEGH